MVFEQLPLELAMIVFDALDHTKILDMRLLSRGVANLTDGYIGEFSSKLDITGTGVDLTVEYTRGKTGKNRKRALIQRRRVLFVNLKNATVNGLGFWLKQLKKIVFAAMDSHLWANDLNTVIVALESVEVQHQVNMEIERTMWLGSSEFGVAMEHLKKSTLNLAIEATMIAKHSFETQRARNATLMPLSKMTNIHMNIPGGRMVSDRLVFEDGHNVNLFKISSCGETRPSLWNVGSMADLFSNCNNVRHVTLHDLTITIHIPLFSADWSLSRVENLSLTNCTLKLSNRTRRKGSNEKRGTLKQARCFASVLEAPGFNTIPIASATFIRDDQRSQLVLDKLNLQCGSKLTTAIVTRDAFKSSSVRHLTLDIGLNMNVLLGFTRLKNLQYLLITPPATRMNSQERQVIESNINRLFSDLDKNCPNFVQASIQGSQLQKSFTRSSIAQ
ncbi:hypothetical protein TRICI_002342 [Trichomonascus ciferrii]|uniref:F-box domain-containing protein n=1 Tax=Trichomonascus ciferrii TaxID=44093 RepID=A0A642VBS2_9ASCO|nr:hypothetical protein TRICI_002342 [Trichomonascus ciferrii]